MKQENFVATIEDIKTLAAQHLTGATAVAKTRSTYLKMLVATTQAELKGTKEITLQMQLNSLELVQKRWKPAVAEAVSTPGIDALERNRRTNFARSAYSLLKSWTLTPGNSFMGLTPAAVTTNGLAKEIKKTPGNAFNATRKRDALNKLMDKFIEQAKLFEHEEARMILDIAVGRLHNELFLSTKSPVVEPVKTKHSKMDDNGYKDMPGQAGRRITAQVALRKAA